MNFCPLNKTIKASISSDTSEINLSKMTASVKTRSRSTVIAIPDSFPASCLSDGKKRIDYVVVYDRVTTSQENIKRLELSLKELGLQFETSRSYFEDCDLNFLKIHAPVDVLIKQADKYNLLLDLDNQYYKKYNSKGFKIFQTPLTKPVHKIEFSVYNRAKFTLSWEKPKEPTNSERIFIVHKMLKRINYGSLTGEVGLDKMQEEKLIKAAYPIHDSDIEWTDGNDPVSDRQLLAKYWGSYECIFKNQPCHLIERYFGPQLAFYFAWLGFYMNMLVPLAFLSVICFFLGLIYMLLHIDDIETEICQSDKVMCPLCRSQDRCQFFLLKNSCNMTKIAYIMDNPFVLVTSVILTLWGVTFIMVWRRHEALLRLRWNLMLANVDRTARDEFIEAHPDVRISSLTGEEELYVPWKKRLKLQTFTFFLFFSLVVYHILAISFLKIGHLMAEQAGTASHNEAVRTNISVISSFVWGLITWALMYTSYYLLNSAQVVKDITNRQMARTERQYHDMYITKFSVLTMVHVILIPLHMAIIKGNFYKHPGHTSKRYWFQIVFFEPCKPSGCLVDVSILMMMTFFTVARKSCNAVLVVYKKKLKLFCFGKRKRKTYFDPRVPQYEKEYYLESVDPNNVSKLQMDQLLRYMLMVCFTPAFPLLPLMVLALVILDLRNDAISYITHRRRIVPQYMPGLGAWNTILIALTLFGVLINDIILCFSSSIIPYFIYLSEYGRTSGFITSRFSEFDVKDLNMEMKGYYSNTTTCYYLSGRNPPDHPDKYELTLDHWNQFSIKCLSFMTIENVTLFVSFLLAYMIPQYPRRVKMKLEDDQIQLKKYKQMMKDRK